MFCYGMAGSGSLLGDGKHPPAPVWFISEPLSEPGIQEGIQTCTLDWRHLGISWTPPLFTFCCLILRKHSFCKILGNNDHGNILCASVCQTPSRGFSQVTSFTLCQEHCPLFGDQG